MTELEIGAKVKDRYTLKEFKGSGSFGEVWLAHDDVIDCYVALKIYISLDSRGIEEFRSEYVTTQGLSHPNLLTTDYYDIWEHRPFLVMKYCANGSSSSLVGRIDEHLLWLFIHDVASGLEYLHDLPDPIIHQDIKPDNILIDDNNRFLITDFGISKRVRSTMRKQSRRAVGAGATAYMGPERFESNSAPVKASDIWSLGASIYELAMGELPFSGLGGGMQKNGAELPSLDNKWSRDLDMIMKSCLAKETWDRPTAGQIRKIAENRINSTDSIEDDNLSFRNVDESEKKVDNTCLGDSDSNSLADNRKNSQQKRKSKRRGYSKRKIGKAIYCIMAVVCLVIVIYLATGRGRHSENNNMPAVTDNRIQCSEDLSETASNANLEKEASAASNDGMDRSDGGVNKDLQMNSKSVSVVSSEQSSGSLSAGTADKTGGMAVKTATINLCYASYTGEVIGNKPDGKGRLTFRSAHSDNLRGYSAEAGDYIEGYFTDGKLDQGTLFRSDGTRLKSIY